LQKLDTKGEEEYTGGTKNFCSQMEHHWIGQATRTTKLLLDLGERTQGGANSEKRAALAATAEVLTAARDFYIDFFLAHAQKVMERVASYSEEHLEIRERLISAHELLTWAESCTVETAAHPHPWTGWNFTERFPAMPFAYRRSVIKGAIGKIRSYLSNRAQWEKSGKKQGKPGLPSATDHPRLYQGCLALDLEALDLQEAFVRLNVYTGEGWRWMAYPVASSRYLVQRLLEADWQRQSPTLVLRAHTAELHIPQVKKIAAKKVMERKQDPALVTVAVDLNVKYLAVITARQHDRIIETVFVTDHGLDAHRYHHLKRIAKKQWQSGKPVAGEHSNQQVWRHIDRLNEDASHKVARQIASVCASYPGCILLFERLRKIKPGKGSKSRRMNRRRANQLRSKIRAHAKDKAYLQQVVTVEVNPHGTSQYCSRCGTLGERFSYQQGQRRRVKWGKLFGCPVCRYEANADFNASVNVHRSFYRQGHWQPRTAKKASSSALVEDSA
jgi:putative transposase